MNITPTMENIGITFHEGLISSINPEVYRPIKFLLTKTQKKLGKG